MISWASKMPHWLLERMTSIVEQIIKGAWNEDLCIACICARSGVCTKHDWLIWLRTLRPKTWRADMYLMWQNAHDFSTASVQADLNLWWDMKVEVGCVFCSCSHPARYIPWYCSSNIPRNFKEYVSATRYDTIPEASALIIRRQWNLPRGITRLDRFHLPLFP